MAGDLEKDENWDFDHAEARPAVKNRRTIVSVAFHQDDFQRVASYAAAAGMKVSEFIREAALEKTRGDSDAATSVISGASSGLVLESGLPSLTRLSGFVSESEATVA